MCQIDVDNYSEVWHEQEVKARKQHVCDGCNGLIAKGSKYTKHFSIFDGQVTSEKCCAACDVDRAEFSKHHEYWMPSPGCLRELVEECLGERESLPMMLKWARVLRRIKSAKVEVRPV